MSEPQLEDHYRSKNLDAESVAYGLTLYRAYRNQATAAVTDGFEQVTGRVPQPFRSFLGLQDEPE